MSESGTYTQRAPAWMQTEVKVAPTLIAMLEGVGAHVVVRWVETRILKGGEIEWCYGILASTMREHGVV